MANDSSPLLVIRLFGPFAARLNDAPLPRLRTRKGEWLLALLTLRAGYDAERDWLAATLWPDSPKDAALVNLRTSLLDLRRALAPGGDRLRSPTTRTLRLDLVGVDVDLVTFDQVIARGDPASLERAVRLYRGPLLEGCAEEWAFHERHVREQAYLAAREKLAAHALAGGDAATTERHLRAAVLIDPFRESAHRALMEVLAAGGNPAVALQVYRELHDRLRRELQTVPDSATAALAQRIRVAAERQATPALAANARSATVPPRAARVSNLPAQPTPLVGREPERAAAGAPLRSDEVRLLTLTGPGGTGKTRLGLQIAADLLDQFADGVILVELAAIGDPGLVASAVAHALGVREREDRPLAARLKEYLQEKQQLLLLDNFEHLLAAAPLVAELLAAAPRLKVLVTSRAVLHLRGEHEFPVPPLDVPDPKRLPPFEALSQYAAVSLFIQRARAVRPGFRVTNANALAVAEICHRLDGLPLAIELAAARIKLFSPQALLQRLAGTDLAFAAGRSQGSPRQLLTGGPRDLPARQQTLRDTIAWSDGLLAAEEKRLFRRLSVFVRGCTLEAAEAVCDAGGECAGARLPGISVPERLTALLDQSLLRQEEPDGGEPRFMMLETIREYAREGLTESGEAEPLERRHADYFLRLAETAEPELRGAEAPVWLERLEAEHDNLRAALARAVERGEAEVCLRLVGALAPFWTMRGHGAEGRQWATQVLGLPGAVPRTPLRAKALFGAARVVRIQGDLATVRALYGESLAISRECGDQDRSARVLEALGDLAREAGQVATAQPLYEESLALYRERDDRRGLAGLLMSMGLMGVEARDWERARTLLEESRAKYQALGDAWGAAAPSVGLATIAANQEQDLDKARRYVEECLAIHRRLDAPERIAISLFQLADVASRQGSDEEAQALLAESMLIARELDSPWWMAHVLTAEGELALRKGDLRAARARHEESLAIWRAGGYSSGQIAGALADVGRVAHRQGDYPSAQRQYAEALAGRWESLCRADPGAVRRQFSNQIGILLCLEGLAAVASATEASEQAARLFGASAALRDTLGLPLPPTDHAEHERYLAALRAALGESTYEAVDGAERDRHVAAARAVLGEQAFEAAWTAGRAMSLKDAVALALDATREG